MSDIKNGERLDKFFRLMDQLLGNEKLPTYNKDKYEFIKLIKQSKDMEYAFVSLAALFASEFPDIFVEMVLVYDAVKQEYNNLFIKAAQSSSKN